MIAEAESIAERKRKSLSVKEILLEASKLSQKLERKSVV